MPIAVWLCLLLCCPAAAFADGLSRTEPSQAPAPAASPAEPTAVRGALDRGREVFNRTCVKCHGDPSSHAPLIGKQSSWKPRIEQGLQTLVRHALEGHGGPQGMPPKGGFSELANDDVAAAVTYIVSESRTLAPDAERIVAACQETPPSAACTPEMSRKYLLLYLFQGLSENHR